MKPSKIPTVLICFIGVGLLCLCGGWILMILNAQGFMRYIIYGLFAASFVFLFVALILFLSLRKKDAREAREAIEQLRRFNEGDLSQRSLSATSPAVQELTTYINDLPLSISAAPEEYGVYPHDVFAEKLRLTLAKSTSVRGCLYLFGLQQKATPQSHGKLRRAVEDAFPGALMGEVKAGIGVYLPSALSAAEEEGRAKQFIGQFVAMENESSMSPTSIGAKVVLCFYPDFDAESLLETAMSYFGEPGPLTVLQNGESHLTPLTLAEASRKDEVAYEDFSMALSKATDERQHKRALRRFIIQVGFGLGYDQIGLALYDPSRNAYRILEELHQEGKSPAFKSLERNLFVAADRIDPYYNLAYGNRLTAINDVLHFTSRPAAILDSLGLRSIACDAIGDQTGKIGFVYLTAENPKAPLSSLEQAALKRFLQACREYVLVQHGIALSTEQRRRMHALTENGERYVYEIDPDTHRLLYLSENLAAGFPKARVGAICHKALLGLDKPCPKCPLVSDSSFEKALAPLGPSQLSFTALSKAPRAMICLSKQSHSLTPRRLDQGLYILNHRALMADLEKDLLNEKEGVALLFTVENALMSAGKIKNGTINDVMTAVLSRLSIASLEEGIYRFDDNTLAYLLPGANKDDAFALAVSVAEELSNPVTLQDREFLPELSYYIFQYPIEVTCPFDLESLMRTCAAKVPAIGKGRVIPFDDSEAPVVLPRAYKEDALKKALNKGSFPLRYSIIRENSSRRPRYVEIGAGLSLAKGEATSPQEVRSLIREERLLTKLEEGEITSFFLSYKQNVKAFKASSLKGVIAYVSKSSLFSPTYMRTLTRGLKDAKVPGGFLHLYFDGNVEESEQEKMEAALKNLREAHVRLIGPYEVGKENDLCFLGFNELPQAMSSIAGGSHLLARVRQAQHDKVSLVLPHVHTEEERSYALSLAIPYGTGALYGQEIEEEELLEAIA